MNIVSIQSETVTLRADTAQWRNVHCLSDDELFAEYRMIREELRRRPRPSGTASVH